MADRYWVGSVGNWNTTSTTNWSATSGGPGGASVPTAADAVIVNAASGAACDLSLNGALFCQSITTTGATCTFSGSGSLTISGNITLSATTTWNQSGGITVNANSTITTNNITIRSTLTINGAGITVTLGSAYTGSSSNANAITLISGTFNTNNFNITTTGYGTIAASGTLTKAINLGTSTVSITASSNTYGWNFSASTGTTVNAASATITQSISGSNNVGFAGGGFTYGTVTLTNNSISATYGIQGTNTFTNLTLTGTSTTNTVGILIYADQTVTGTLTAAPATTGGRFRFLIYSDTAGTARTISAGTTTLTDVDFRDITKAGAAGWTGTRLGDAGGNTGITFATPKTVYWNNLSSGVSWNSNSWASSSGGAVAAANYPLPQDTTRFSNTGTTSMSIAQPAYSGIVYQGAPSAITATGLTNTITITAPIFNNCTFTDTSTLSLGGSLFLSRSTQTLYLANGPIYPTGQITLNSPNNSTFQITAAWTSTAASITLNAGTFNLNGFDATLTAGTFNFNSGTISLGANTLNVFNFVSSVANTRAIQFGTGNITCTGSGNSWYVSNGLNLTYTGTPTVNISVALGGTLTACTTAGAVTNAFDFNVTTGGPITISSGSVVRNLNFTGYTGIWSPGIANCFFYGNLTLVAGMTFTSGSGIFTFVGASGVQTITSAGKTLGPITINNTGTSVQLVGTTTGGTITFTQGTLDINSVTTSFSSATLNNNSPSSVINGTLITLGSVNHVSGTFTLGTSGNLTTASTYTFTAGSIVLGSNTLTALIFSSSNSNVRSINFGTGQITLTGNAATIWTTATATNFTYSGTPKIVSNYSGSGFAARTFSFGAITVPFTVGSGSGNQVSFGTAGTDLVAFAGSVLSLDFTGFTGTGQLGTNALSITSGNLTLVPGMAVTNGATPISFTATSGTQTITSAGKTIAPITISGVGGTVELADNASIFGAITLTNGTFNANNKDITALFFVSNNSNTRTLTMGSGTWTLSSGTSTVWDLTTTTGLTFNKDTANIVLSDTSTGPRTFAGGGLTYNNLTIGGATGISTTTFTGNNTFNTLASTKTVAHTITLPASGTTTVANWTITGTAGNVVTLNSSSAGTQATLSKSGGGTVTVDYLSIRDSAATPGSTWTATNSTDVSNNTGWTFAVAVANSNYFLMF